MGLLPVAGAVQVRTADDVPAVAAVMTGAPGTVYGMTAVDFGLAADVPNALVAVTENVYDPPAVRPVKVRDRVEPSTFTVVPATPARKGVTEYDVIALPFAAGATQVAVALVVPATAVGAASVAGGAAYT
jgi:hypothetical protein